MDVVERLTFEAVQEPLLTRAQHHRYELAARLLAGSRILELACGAGRGCGILAEQASEVTGVDAHAASIEAARAGAGREHPKLAFELADPLCRLRGRLRERFDAIVCFEALERLGPREQALERLREHAHDGLRLLIALPNATTPAPGTPDASGGRHGVGYEEALVLCERFPRALMLVQFEADGSLIRAADSSGFEVEATLADAGEVDYASCFILCAGFEERELDARRASAQLAIAPSPSRRWQGLEQALRALRAENARLTRGLLGKSGSAAAAALVRLQANEGELAELRDALAFAHARVAELEATLGEGARWPDPARCSPAEALPPPAIVSQPAITDPAAAAAVAIAPWIDRATSLAQRTVALCAADGAPLAHALAERAGRLLTPEPGELEQALGASGPQRIEVLVLAGILHRLGPDERRRLLARARDALAPDGAIVLLEEPNRLALGREEGLGPSDFEAAFDRPAAHVIASGYDMPLLLARPVIAEEVLLARWLARARPDLAPAFSRARIELVLSAAPLARRPPLLHPWTADTTASPGVGFTAGEELRLLAGGVLRIALPEPASVLVIGAIFRHERELRLSLAPEGGDPLVSSHGGPPGVVAYSRFELPAAAQQLVLTASEECRLKLVGYER
jgi:SAM-dependent methyltransferase